MTSGHYGHYTANHHGAFMDQETHELMVRNGDHFDTVLTPHQTSEVFMGLIVVIVAAQIGLHWWKKNRSYAHLSTLAFYLILTSAPCTGPSLL